MRIKLVRIISPLLLFCLMVVIFLLSAQTATKSGKTSHGFMYEFFCMFYPGFSQMATAVQDDIIGAFSFVFRKTAHFSLYFGCGFLSFFSVITYKRIKLVLRPFISFAVCVLYATSDEIHQYFVPGRSCEMRDILIDSSGALLATVILFLLCFFSKKIRNKIV